MKIAIALLVSALLMVTLAGCGGLSLQSPVVLNLSGTWQFVIHSNSGTTATANGTLVQNGTSLTGQLALSGAPCATTAAFTGAISGTTLNFQLQEGNQAVLFSGSVSVNGTSASGKYAAPSGGCTNGDMGTWAATKI
jgi:hypothetical protein